MSDSDYKRGIEVERKRCVEIVQACRFGELDQDFRSIVSMIESGETAEQMKSRDAYPA